MEFRSVAATAAAVAAAAVAAAAEAAAAAAAATLSGEDYMLNAPYAAKNSHGKEKHKRKEVSEIITALSQKKGELRRRRKMVTSKADRVLGKASVRET